MTRPKNKEIKNPAVEKKTNKFIFNKYNFILLTVGIILLVFAYLLMAQGDITISPIILTLTYAVIFPLAIVINYVKIRKKK